MGCLKTKWTWSGKFRVRGFHGACSGDVEEVTGYKSLMLCIGNVTGGLLVCRWELKLKEQTRAQIACADGIDAAKDAARRKALEGDCEGGVRERAERQERGMSFRAERMASRFK